MLAIEDIHTYYGNSYILQGVSLNVQKNEIVALLGRNGVGKTTLARSVMGLTSARRGRILFNGEDITSQKAFNIAQKGVGYVPQGRMIFPSLSVAEHLEVAYRKGKNGREDWTIERALECFPQLKERLGNRGNQLSGGEQQMLAIARALVTNPDFLVMDEPTEGLAPIIVRELGILLEMIKNRGYPVLLVEQNLKFALEYADTVYIMSKGAIVYKGCPSEIEGNEEIKRKYLGMY